MTRTRCRDKPDNGYKYHIGYTLVLESQAVKKDAVTKVKEGPK